MPRPIKVGVRRLYQSARKIRIVGSIRDGGVAEESVTAQPGSGWRRAGGVMFEICVTEVRRNLVLVADIRASAVVAGGAGRDAIAADLYVPEKRLAKLDERSLVLHNFGAQRLEIQRDIGPRNRALRRGVPHNGHGFGHRHFPQRHDLIHRHRSGSGRCRQGRIEERILLVQLASDLHWLLGRLRCLTDRNYSSDTE